MVNMDRKQMKSGYPSYSTIRRETKMKPWFQS